MELTDRHALPLLAAGQAQKELTHNEALTMIDALLHPAVEAAGLDQPPAAPQPGQLWIVGNAPVAEWAGWPGALACWTDNGWRLIEPREGMRVFDRDTGLWIDHIGGVWTAGMVRGGSLVISGIQVAGPQQPAVADPAGGATVDSEARLAIATLLQRLRSHGLIAT